MATDLTLPKDRLHGPQRQRRAVEEIPPGGKVGGKTLIPSAAVFVHLVNKRREEMCDCLVQARFLSQIMSPH